METKETLEEYLIRILRTSENEKYIKEYRYAFLEQAKKEYYNYLKKLNLPDDRDGLIKDLFVELHKNGITPSKYLTKKMGYNDALLRLSIANERAKNAYKYILSPKFEELINVDTPYDEIEILRNDYQRINDIRGYIENSHDFLGYFNKVLSEFYSSLYKTINILGEPHFNKISFPEVVDTEIELFKSFKLKYFKDVKDESMYNGKNDNPFKNLYVYSLGRYLKYFYVLGIPHVTHDMFPDIGVICEYEKKDKYTLKDVAKVYALTYDLEESKVIENIKKLFQKIPFIQNYKNGNRYAFSDLLLPVMAYHIFKRHNIDTNENNLAINSSVRVFGNICYPLFKAKVNGHAEYIDAYIKYWKFLLSEFNDAIKHVDDAYLEICINELFVSSIGRLSLRVITDNPKVLKALEMI